MRATRSILSNEMPTELAKEIARIACSLRSQLNNLEGLCSTVQTLGSGENYEALAPVDVGQMMGVIASCLRDIRAGVDHIACIGKLNRLDPDGGSGREGLAAT